MASDLHEAWIEVLLQASKGYVYNEEHMTYSDRQTWQLTDVYLQRTFHKSPITEASKTEQNETVYAKH